MTGGGDTGAVWSRHVVDIHRAVREGLPRDIETLRAGLGDPDAWAQEYELEWLDEASAWLPYDLIDSCEHADAGDPGLYGGGHAWIGMDIARRQDLTVIVAVEQVGDVLWARDRREMRRASFAAQAQALRDMVMAYRPLRIALDQTGMGEAVVEQAQDAHGRLRVDGVLFTGPTKQHLAGLLKERMEDRRLRLPAGDAALRADLHSLRRVTTPAGNVRFDVDASEAAAARSHADRAWALALAVYASSTGAEVYDYRAVPRGRNRRRDRRGEDRPQRLVRATGGWSR